MVGRVLTGGTPDTAVAICITLACNRSSVYERSEVSFVREEKVRTSSAGGVISRFQFGE
jgi:hypothetical protein